MGALDLRDQLRAGAAMVVQVASDAAYAAAVAAGRWLVVVGAAWCQPCRSTDEVLDRLTAARGKGRSGLDVLRVDLDRCQLTALALGVRGVPFLALVEDGAVVAHRLGHAPLPTLTAWVDDHFKPKGR